VTFAQPFGDALNLSVQAHPLYRLPPPDDAEVARVTACIAAGSSGCSSAAAWILTAIPKKPTRCNAIRSLLAKR